jgi:16S rRNA (guanine966-N2)-methyltransferase
MRIISGTLGGRVLQIPRHASFRPTTDRVKESIFNMLAHRMSLANAHVCDLFAGSGALGLEALSRGAAHVTFVERDRHSLDALRRNIAALDVADRCTLQPVPVESFLQRLIPAEATFDLVLADPPYALTLAVEQLANVRALLKPEALFVYEHDGRQTAAMINGLEILLARSFGTTACTIYQRLEVLP